MIKRILLLAVIMIFCANVQAKPESDLSPDIVRQVMADGKERFYELHLPPAYKKGFAWPVVFVFHGGGGNPKSVRFESGMNDIADKNNFIVVYPAGSGKLKDRFLVWNDGREYIDGTSNNSDDIAFVKVILADLSELLSIDKKRIYACGFSNGAQFTYRLANEIPESFAAIAAVAGQRPCLNANTNLPISVMQFSGTQDIYAPYNGGEPYKGESFFPVKFKTKLLPVVETIASWCKLDGCPDKPYESKRRGQARELRYGPGKENSEVVLWTLENGGHTWPGGRITPFEAALKLGNINQDISASELIWDFFKRHSR